MNDIMAINMVILSSIIVTLLLVIYMYNKYCNKLTIENSDLKNELTKLKEETYTDEESEEIEKQLQGYMLHVDELNKEIAMYKDMIDDQIKIKETTAEVIAAKKKYKTKKIQINKSEDAVEKVLTEFVNNPEVNAVIGIDISSQKSDSSATAILVDVSQQKSSGGVFATTADSAIPTVNNIELSKN